MAEIKFHESDILDGVLLELAGESVLTDEHLSQICDCWGRGKHAPCLSYYTHTPYLYAPKWHESPWREAALVQQRKFIVVDGVAPNGRPFWLHRSAIELSRRADIDDFELDAILEMAINDTPGAWLATESGLMLFLAKDW